MTRLGLIVAIFALAACGLGPSADDRLFHAAAHGDSKLVAKLLDSGANPAASDEDGWTALLWASAHGDAASVELLVAAGSDLEAVTTREKQTPLILAARLNRVEVVRTLIKRGAKIRSVDGIGWNALMWAALKGREDVVTELLKAGAGANVVDSDGNTPLILAARQGRVETVAILLSHGADRKAKNSDGKTALDYAEAGNYDDAAELLQAKR